VITGTTAAPSVSDCNYSIITCIWLLLLSPGFEAKSTNMNKNDIKIDFQHRQAAHCESGVTASLLTHHGIPISEAMAFGIGGGIFFGYLPFIRMNHLPLTTFRTMMGNVFSRTTKWLGVQVHRQRFRNQEESMDVLDNLLEKGIPVGIRTGAFWLPYFPPAYRFHFNGHNSVVYGRQGDEYLISDPVFEDPVTCSRADLKRARFAKGAMAPRGLLYYLHGKTDQADLEAGIRKGIYRVCKDMLHVPMPLIGVRGIRFLANRLENWPAKLGEKRAAAYLGQLIRMQEEIGTGGGGFRFIYAAFLQETADLLAIDALHSLSEKMTEIGDRWRESAMLGARICKGRTSVQEGYPAMAALLRDCASKEETFFQNLEEYGRKG